MKQGKEFNREEFLESINRRKGKKEQEA